MQQNPIFSLLEEKGARLVIAQVMEGVRAESRYALRQLFGDDAFYETLADVVIDYRQKMGAGTD